MCVIFIRESCVVVACCWFRLGGQWKCALEGVSTVVPGILTTTTTTTICHAVNDDKYCFWLLLLVGCWLLAHVVVFGAHAFHINAIGMHMLQQLTRILAHTYICDIYDICIVCLHVCLWVCFCVASEIVMSRLAFIFRYSCAVAYKS